MTDPTQTQQETGEAPNHTSAPIRLEDLSPRQANKPEGRGAETAAGRGYDVERLIAEIFDGSLEDREPWYDVKYGTMIDHFLECKSCVDRYPCGTPGMFTIWRSHHDRLVRADSENKRAISYYVFVVYSVVDNRAAELGKFGMRAKTLDDIIDDWRLVDHDTMGTVATRQISWKRLLSAVGLNFDDLIDRQITVPDQESTAGES